MVDNQNYNQLNSGNNNVNNNYPGNQQYNNNYPGNQQNVNINQGQGQNYYPPNNNNFQPQGYNQPNPNMNFNMQQQQGNVNYNYNNNGNNYPVQQNQNQPIYNQQITNQPQNLQPLLDQIKKELQLCSDPMVLLAESQVCYVKQQVCMMELVSGCDTQNVYDVYSRNSKGQIVFLFKCKEKSGCCERQYCRGDSRPFKMHVKHVQNNGIMDPDMMEDFAVFDRPYKCTCLCLERPKMKGFYRSETGQMFGSITEPWTCCDPLMVIKDQNKEPQFQIHGDCCQCGIMCRNSCGKCSEVQFPIYPATCTDFQPQNSIGMIKKTSGDLLKELLTDADNFEVLFPPNASPEEKLLMIGAALMIDYRYFEDTTNDQKGKRNNGF